MAITQAKLTLLAREIGSDQMFMVGFSSGYRASLSLY
jgi:hypothetical protein